MLKLRNWLPKKRLLHSTIQSFLQSLRRKRRSTKVSWMRNLNLMRNWQSLRKVLSSTRLKLLNRPSLSTSWRLKSRANKRLLMISLHMLKMKRRSIRLRRRDTESWLKWTQHLRQSCSSFRQSTISHLMWTSWTLMTSRVLLLQTIWSIWQWRSSSLNSMSSRKKSKNTKLWNTVFEQTQAHTLRHYDRICIDLLILNFIILLLSNLTY